MLEMSKKLGAPPGLVALPSRPIWTSDSVDLTLSPETIGQFPGEERKQELRTSLGLPATSARCVLS